MKFTANHINEVVAILNTANAINDPSIKRLVTISALSTASKNLYDFIINFDEACQLDEEEAKHEMTKRAKHINEMYMTLFDVYGVDIDLAVEYFDDIASAFIYGI